MLMGAPITGRIPHERTPEHLSKCLAEKGFSDKRDHYRRLFSVMGFKPAEVEEKPWGMVGTYANTPDAEQPVEPEESNDS
jgi:hypothetical protein